MSDRTIGFDGDKILILDKDGIHHVNEVNLFSCEDNNHVMLITLTYNGKFMIIDASYKYFGLNIIRKNHALSIEDFYNFDEIYGDFKFQFKQQITDYIFLLSKIRNKIV